MGRKKKLCGSHGPPLGSPLKAEAGGLCGAFPGPQLEAPEWAGICPPGPKAAQEGPASGMHGSKSDVQVVSVISGAVRRRDTSHKNINFIHFTVSAD